MLAYALSTIDSYRTSRTVQLTRFLDAQRPTSRLPEAIAPSRWLFAFSMAYIGLLIAGQIESHTTSLLVWIAAGPFTFTVVAVVGYIVAMSGRWSALFRRPTINDAILGVCYAVLGFIVATSVASMLSHFTTLHSNPVSTAESHATTAQVVMLHVATIVQLIGEELIAITLLMLVLSIAYKYRSSGPMMTFFAFMVSSLFFGALHIWTYGNVLQALIVIGVARIYLSLAYISTRNVWTSYISHVVYDEAPTMVFTLLAPSIVFVHG